MRKTVHHQPALFPAYIQHSRAEELKEISRLLDETPGLARLVCCDLVRGVDAENGRDGMSAEQVLRCAVAKQLEQWSYDELAFHLQDSTTYRAFCRLGLGEKAPKSSALQENIAKISVETWGMLHQSLVGQAAKEGIEKGRKIRFDCTVTETDIHYPTDALLCVDLIRVGCRILKRLRDDAGFEIVFRNHQLRSRRRANNIRNRRKKSAKKKAYKDLLKVTRKTRGYLADARQVLVEHAERLCEGDPLFEDIKKLSILIRQADQLIDQTTRRIFEGEKVPADEKIYSIFEEHTDLIIKKGREVEFGHKLCLAVGDSSVITDVTVEKGNPNDSQLAEKMVDRQQRRYKRYPRQVAFDGGFASIDNLEALKDRGIKDVAFHKKKGMKISEMVRSSWVYKKLRRFRAGIEGIISWVKRCFGLARCDWKGWKGFNRYVLSSVFSANALTMARHRIEARAG